MFFPPKQEDSQLKRIGLLMLWQRSTGVTTAEEKIPLSSTILSRGFMYALEPNQTNVELQRTGRFNEREGVSQWLHRQRQPWYDKRMVEKPWIILEPSSFT